MDNSLDHISPDNLVPKILPPSVKWGRRFFVAFLVLVFIILGFYIWYSINNSTTSNYIGLNKSIARYTEPTIIPLTLILLIIAGSFYIHAIIQYKRRSDIYRLSFDSSIVLIVTFWIFGLYFLLPKPVLPPLKEPSIGFPRCTNLPPGAICGRPFRSRKKKKSAEALLQESSDWSTLTVPDGLKADEMLGEFWRINARMEHAAIAAFSRLSLDLLVLGATPELLQKTSQALSDEIRHAEACFSLASAYSKPVSPGLFEDLNSDEEGISFPILAYESFIDGCIGEAIASILANDASKKSSDVMTQGILQGISEDEHRHAELGWEILEWTFSKISTEDKDLLMTDFYRIIEDKLSQNLKEGELFHNDFIRLWSIVGITQFEYSNIARGVYLEAIGRLKMMD